MILEIVLPIIKQIICFGFILTIFLLGTFGLRLYNRGEILEQQYPGLCQKMLKSISKWFYRSLATSLFVILLLGHWDINFISISYFGLLPWIVFVRIRTWKDKSSLLEYRFIQNNFLRYCLIVIPLQIFALLSILQLLFAALL